MYNKILNNETYKNAMNKICEKEKDRIFCCHGIEHCLDVARISYIIALENNIDISKELIYSAALLHDIGRSVQNDNHDIYGVEIVEKILKECGITDAEEILSAVKNHRKEAATMSNLSDIIKKADKISRNCYNCKAYNECYWSEERKNKAIIY